MALRKTARSSAAALLVFLLGCSAPAGPADQPPAAAPAALPLIEASGICVRGDGRVAIIGGDETPDKLWGVSLDDFSVRWELPFPPGTPPIDDIEALAPWRDSQVFVMCSQTRTKTRGKAKPERNRLALVTLTPDARRIVSARVFENLRDRLVAHLSANVGDMLENPAVLADGTPVTGGLNVEGLAAWKGQLLVGLRSPTARGGGAIVAAIRNPEKLFSDAWPAATPDFGKPMVVRAAPGEGIRDMAAAGDGVLVLFGASGESKGPDARVVRWNPETGEVRPVKVKGLGDVGKPEGIALDPQGRLLVVQDVRPPVTKPVMFRLEIEPNP
jgi:hypothetical protein